MQMNLDIRALSRMSSALFGELLLRQRPEKSGAYRRTRAQSGLGLPSNDYRHDCQACNSCCSCSGSASPSVLPLQAFSPCICSWSYSTKALCVEVRR